MTLLIDKNLADRQPWRWPRPSRALTRTMPRRLRIIEIALINNMPDAALEATERQFMRLLHSAAGPTSWFSLHCFSLPSVQRSPQATSRIERLYAEFAEL